MIPGRSTSLIMKHAPTPLDSCFVKLTKVILATLGAPMTVSAASTMFECAMADHCGCLMMPDGSLYETRPESSGASNSVPTQTRPTLYADAQRVYNGFPKTIREMIRMGYNVRPSR